MLVTMPTCTQLCHTKEGRACAQLRRRVADQARPDPSSLPLLLRGASSSTSAGRGWHPVSLPPLLLLLLHQVGTAGIIQVVLSAPSLCPPNIGRTCVVVSARHYARALVKKKRKKKTVLFLSISCLPCRMGLVGGECLVTMPNQSDEGGECSSLCPSSHLAFES